MDKKEVSLIYHRLVAFQDYLDHLTVDDIDISYELQRLSHRVGDVYEVIADKIFE